MKTIILVLSVLALTQCLYEDSKYVKTLKWATFKKDVMESDEPWFLNFGSDNCPDCKSFASIYEQAAKTQNGEVNYGYVDITKEKGISNFFGMGGQNLQIFLTEDKPAPAGNPAFFSWPKDLKNVLQFAKNEIFVKKRAYIFKGTEHIQKLDTKAQLETQVLKSREPWFLMFCSESQPQDCMDLVYEYHNASKNLSGKVKFGLVDTLRSEIVNVFGINGIGVCIFLGVEKPGPVGSPSLVGSQLKQKDYEKHVWDILELSATDASKAIVNQFPNVPEVNYQQIMRHTGAYLIFMYSGSEVFGDDEALKANLQILSELKIEDEKIKIGRFSVDDNKWIVQHYDLWPIPGIFYFPINTKSSETIIRFGEKNPTAETVSKWAVEQLFDNINDKQVILTRDSFENTVMKSEEAWFVQFYTLNNNYCRKCPHLQPEWKKLSNGVNGRVNIAKLNCDVAKDVCQKFECWNFPKLVFFPGGQKYWTLEKNIDYDGAFSQDQLLQFALDNASILELQKVSHLDNSDTFEKYCKNFNGICFISMLPKEGAEKSEPRSVYLDHIQEANSALAKEPVSFLYSIDGDQPELQERFELCNKGFPCTIGIDFRREKELGFKVFFRKFSAQDLQKNINDLLTERRAFIPVKKELPKIQDVVNPGKNNKHDDL